MSGAYSSRLSERSRARQNAGSIWSAPQAAVLKSSDGSTMIAHAQSPEQAIRADAMAKHLLLCTAGPEARVPTTAAAGGPAAPREYGGQSAPSRVEEKVKEIELAQARRRAAMFVAHTETFSTRQCKFSRGRAAAASEKRGHGVVGVTVGGVPSVAATKPLTGHRIPCRRAGVGRSDCGDSA